MELRKLAGLGMPETTEASKEQFIDMMAGELARVANTTANPARFLEESGDALRQALHHLIGGAYANEKRDLLGLIDNHFPEAKKRAMNRLFILRSN